MGRCNAEGYEADKKRAEGEGEGEGEEREREGANWSVEGCLNVDQFDTL